MSATSTPNGPDARTIGLMLGPLLAVLLQMFPPPEGLGRDGWVVASLAVLMATWWATEAVPIAVTSLLPLVILPVAGVQTTTEVGASFGNHIVILLLGGFFIALALERWNLHTRIALNVVVRAGGRPRLMILGFMVAAALLSMWISNTATTLMLMPIALSAARAEVGEEGLNGPFALALILGVAYAASIGGVATPVGTPTNLIAIRALEDDAGVTVSFPQWMALGVPAAAIMVPVVWLILTRVVFPISRETATAGAAQVRQALNNLGGITGPEVRVALIFAVVAIAWIVRQPALNMVIDAQSTQAAADFWRSMNNARADAAIAIAGAITTFVAPAGRRAPGERIMDWATAKNVPWDVVLLFGGGIALAGAMSATGLTVWLGAQLEGVANLHPVLIVLVFVTAIIFLTELTSNVATVTAFAPVLVTIAAASAGRTDPVALVAPAALAGSFAFMLPVATAPNAIVYATGRVRIDQMMRTGLHLNLAAIPVLTLVGVAIGPLVT